MMTSMGKKNNLRWNGQRPINTFQSCTSVFPNVILRFSGGLKPEALAFTSKQLLK